MLVDWKKILFHQVYDTYEAHRSFAASSAYPSFLAACKPALASKPEPIQFNINADLTEIFSAPLTQFIFITLKPGQKKDVLAALLDSVLQEFHVLEGAHKGTWGVSVQKDDSSLAIVGWENKEVSVLTCSIHAP